MLQIYEHDKIMDYFTQYPTATLTVHCPGSGSWCETFDNRDHYIRRKNSYDEWIAYTAKLPTHQYDDEANRLMRVFMANKGHHSNPWEHENVYVSYWTGSVKPPRTFNGTENIIQNYCVTFSHNFNHKYSRITNIFVVKGAPLTKESALKIAEILFPRYTDIVIESIENDKNTLTPSEYFFLQGVLKEKLYERRWGMVERRKENPEAAKVWDNYSPEEEYDWYLLELIKKMETRMDQFPTYHT